ncbi:hypothetical protein JCGZ_02697 [Jatropha curcas]|uniref:SHSP domain-containing protein n=1 Tax=Jatropha curcas TaxID=180498 RepID=A0A067KU60_JATCU|nr:inactive protein RESTRICTED TEV MOVEMENT 2 [Jatropha curcas]KDP39677.1 hypothetical protein JCGZ_02697 [Jatropha curcas]
MAGANITSYEDFEPYCKWQRAPECDTLEVHLHGFKKNQLKINVSNLGVMTVTGERLLDDSKRSRFCREIKLSKDHKTNEIRAKLTGGILYIVMPKKAPLSTLLAPENQESERTRKKATSNKELVNTTTMISTENNAALLNLNKLSSYGFPLKDWVLKLRTRNFAIAFAAVIVVTAFAMYKHHQPQNC